MRIVARRNASLGASLSYLTSTRHALQLPTFVLSESQRTWQARVLLDVLQEGSNHGPAANAPGLLPIGVANERGYDVGFRVHVLHKQTLRRLLPSDQRGLYLG